VGSIVVLEKPFSENLAEAIELHLLLSDLSTEQDVFRVDHFLAMSTVQNVLGTRLTDRVLEPIWNSVHIAKVDAVWDESLALEAAQRWWRWCTLAECRAHWPDHAPRPRRPAARLIATARAQCGGFCIRGTLDTQSRDR
jgi:hypothetical protein